LVFFRISSKNLEWKKALSASLHIYKDAIWCYRMCQKEIYIVHGNECLNGIFTLCSFTREHNTIGPIQNSIGHITAFGTCWTWLANLQ
jgi:hypothetical protein